MAETFILIPGRTSRQGTALNEGKFTAAYVEETSTLFMCNACVLGKAWFLNHHVECPLKVREIGAGILRH